MGRPVAEGSTGAIDILEDLKGDRVILVVGRVGCSSLFFSFSQGRNKSLQYLVPCLELPGLTEEKIFPETGRDLLGESTRKKARQ